MCLGSDTLASTSAKSRHFLQCPRVVDWWEFPIPAPEAGTLPQPLLDQLAEVSWTLSASPGHSIDPGIRLHLPHFSGSFLAAACWCLLCAAAVVGLSWEQLASITFLCCHAAFYNWILAGGGMELHSAAREDADMANSHPFVALQTLCQMAAVLKSCSVYRGNGSLRAYGLLGI